MPAQLAAAFHRWEKGHFDFICYIYCCCSLSIRSIPMRFPACLLLILAWAMVPAGSSADPGKRELVISLLVTSGEQRDTFLSLSQRFEAQHPGVRVRWIAREDANYKAMLGQWLRDPKGPDVVYWHAGTRLRQIAEAGHLAPLDELWAAEGFDATYPAATRAKVSFDGRVYAVPYSFYQWGFYYRASVFKRLGLVPPQTWEQFLGFCQRARSENIVPVIIGSKHEWPLAAWFDYINLRLNGLEFHQAAVAGEVPFTDSRIENVFEHWKTLLDADCFIAVNVHVELDYKATLPFLYRGWAATTLMGNFLAPQLPESLRNDFRFFPFPAIDPGIGQYEEAPTDVFALPLRSAGNADALAFIAFIGKAEQQSLLNNRTGKISTNSNAKIADDYFIKSGAELLAQADGLAEFFDRDAPKAMAEPALQVFRRFMSHRDTTRAMESLEKARQAAFGAVSGSRSR